MTTHEDQTPADGEDIPSDFFDEFSKDEFIEGLSVIDSWDDGDDVDKKRRSRIKSDVFDNVKDLRELIHDGKEDEVDKQKSFVQFNSKYKWRKPDTSQRNQSSSNQTNDLTTAGSRRDPSKTNEAIKKDKEVKVKEYLAKQLQSSEDPRPPGTELDDYFDEDKPPQKKAKVKTSTEDVQETHQKILQAKSRDHHWEQPPDHRSPRWKPHRSPHRSPRPSTRLSPHRKSRRQYSPQRHSERKYSSPHRSFRRSPRRPIKYSPRRSPKPIRRSRSPFRRRQESKYSRARSPLSRSPHRDGFFNLDEQNQPMDYPLHPYMPQPHSANSVENNFGASAPSYSYPQTQSYGGYMASYVPPVSVGLVPTPQPVPAPAIDPTLGPGNSIASALPTSNQIIPTSMLDSSVNAFSTGYYKPPSDALAQLLAEGKITKEDYLKLAPNKGISGIKDPKSIHDEIVLNRCTEAIAKLEDLVPNNQLIVNVNDTEPKYLTAKYSSPLKRQATAKLHFTEATMSTSTTQQNKQIINCINAMIGRNLVSSSLKKTPRNTKEAATQTFKPFCDVCAIRDSTRFFEVSTSIDLEHITSTVHTQVVEHELLNSKSVFNPSGSVTDGGTISIAHLTPAQLVSQLAARAKTLKQNAEPTHSSNPFDRRPPPGNYRGRGGHQYQNYNNYHY